MALTSQINVLASTDGLTSAIWNQEIGNLYAGLTGISTAQLAAKAVTLAKLADAANPGKRESDHGLTSYVSSRPDSNSFRFSSATTLADAKLGAGVAYVLKTSSNELVQIDRSSGPIPVPTLTASTTNYVFLKADNTLRASTSATAAADEMVIISLVTNGTTVTSNTFLARTSPLTNAMPKGYKRGLVIVPGATPANQITIKSGFYGRDDQNTFDGTETASDITIGLSTDLDTGAEASSTTYAAYVLYDSTGANSAIGKWSANLTTPTLPATHNKYVRVCYRRNDGSSNLLAASTYDNENILELSASAATNVSTTETEIDALTPMNMNGQETQIKKVLVQTLAESGSSGGGAIMAASVWGGGTASTTEATAPFQVGVTVSLANSSFRTTHGWVGLGGTNSRSIRAVSFEVGVTVRVAGWWDALK